MFNATLHKSSESVNVMRGVPGHRHQLHHLLHTSELHAVGFINRNILLFQIEISQVKVYNLYFMDMMSYISFLFGIGSKSIELRF